MRVGVEWTACLIRSLSCGRGRPVTGQRPNERLERLAATITRQKDRGAPSEAQGGHGRASTSAVQAEGRGVAANATMTQPESLILRAVRQYL